MLPTALTGRAISLGEGSTPLIDAPRLASRIGVHRAWIKNEGVNPTGSFKDRGASVALARALELGVQELAIPSSGNAGAATAAYGAALGIRVHVFAPVETSPITCAQIRAFGADLQQVEGSFTECGAAAAEAAERNGWFFYATLREPYRIEGKKTMAYEVVEQLGFRVPDVILYPTGGTTGFIALWKAFEEMEHLGWIGSERPRMISVQAQGCAPVVRAFERGADTIDPWGEVRTYASGLSAPTVFGGHLTMKVLRESNGAGIAVADTTMAEWVEVVGRETGIFVSPEGAAVAAAARMLRERGLLSETDEVVLFATATGLKYVGREPHPAPPPEF